MPASTATREPSVETLASQPVARQPVIHPRVIVVGAGFGGLNAARALANRDVDVLLLDRNNYHGFWPLLYQVATAGLEPESIAYPVRAIARKYANITFLMAAVRGVDFGRKLVHTDGAPIAYDYLVLAAGSTTNYFGNDALAGQTCGLKDIDDAERLRNHLLAAFEQAVRERNADRRAALMTLVIVGGGPTGVELAGAFVELIDYVLRKDYPMLDLRQARVVLVEAHDRILATFPARLQQRARRRLERMDVEVRLNAPVDSVEQGVIAFRDGTHLAAGTVVWTAGVRGAQLVDTLPVDVARGTRVKVAPTLSLPGRPEVFVIGDMAYLEGYKGDAAFPMVAPVAIQQGEQAARNILAQIQGRPMRAFRYVDKGQMATIGRRAAVLDAFGMQLDGRIAWIGWLLVHLIQLVGFRNRLIVLTNWAYNYVTYDHGVRLITGEKC